MQAQSTPFSGLSLTQIFQIQPLQSLLIKFWYLGLVSECITHKEDVNTFKTIRKSLNFANCFTFQMPIRTYITFMDRIIKVLSVLEPKPIFQVLLGHLRNNKINSVSFQLFGVAFLQLFGRSLQNMNTFLMNKVLRDIYIQLTIVSKSGVATMKSDRNAIKQLQLQQCISKQYLNIETDKKQQNNPQNTQTNMQNSQNNPNPKDTKTLKGRMQYQAQLNSSLRDGQYPTGDRMRVKDQASISCFMMGGFEIVDYSESINQLHRKLLTKILLNK